MTHGGSSPPGPDRPLILALPPPLPSRVFLASPPTQTDDAAMAALFSSPHFLRHLPLLAETVSVEEMADRRQIEAGCKNVWAFRVHEAASGAFVGTAKLRRVPDFPGSCEVGIGIVHEMKGRGISEEVLFLLLDLAFKPFQDAGLECSRVSFTTSVHNSPMCAILERWIGATHEGTLREAWASVRDGSVSDVAIYAILRREWREGGCRDRLLNRVKNRLDE
ncbi:acyl-CoA N-acyltransferase [Chytriomyces sp. MP71]|nr:acyl-CoA N-acyltransferase [Chytriomyces sp. MP71]